MDNNALMSLSAATQILTLICLFKDNPAWKGSLALLFICASIALFYKYRHSHKKPYLLIGIGMGLIGMLLMVWFVLS